MGEGSAADTGGQRGGVALALDGDGRGGFGKLGQFGVAQFESGPAEVFLDGQSRGRVDPALENFPRLAQIPVFSAQGLADRTHTLRIVNTTTNFVLVDAFKVSVGVSPDRPR